MNDMVHNLQGVVGPAIGPVIDDFDVFVAKSRTELAGRVVGDVLAGCAVVTVRGGRGVGKTSLMHVLAAELRARKLAVIRASAALHNPPQVQRMIAQAKRVLAGSGVTDQLRGSLCREGGAERLVLIVDDARAGSGALFRALWQLVDCRPPGAAQIQLVLCGEVGPWSGLEHPGLDGLRRASAACHLLLPFQEEEAFAYLDRRLRQAGLSCGTVMTPAAAAELIEQAHCVPARLDMLAGRVLLHYGRGRTRITLRRLQRALSNDPAEQGPPGPAVRPRRLVTAGVCAGAMALAAAAFVQLRFPLTQVVTPWLAAGTATVGGMQTAPRNAQTEALRPGGPQPAPMPPNARHPAPTGLAANAVARNAAPEPHAPQPAKPLPEQTVKNPVQTKLAEAQHAPAATTTMPSAPPHEAAPARTALPGGPGLVLVASAGDDMPALYARVYRGLTPPPYPAVLAVNRMPVRPGALLIFPEPPEGWSRR